MRAQGNRLRSRWQWSTMRCCARRWKTPRIDLARGDGAVAASAPRQPAIPQRGALAAPVATARASSRQEQTAAAIREKPASADAVAAYLKQPRVDQEPTWRTIFGASPTRGAVLRLCAAFGVDAHDTLAYHGFETLACFKNAIRAHLKWYAPGRKTCRARRGICRRLQAAPRLHGKRSALTMSVQAHYDRLLKPLRLEGLWKWRDAALAIADAGVPLQTGTVAVERWWASLKHMMPANAACISERWFRVLLGLAYLRHNHRHFASGSLPSWCQRDPLLQQRLAYFADCARLVQSEGDGHLSAIFDPFR